MNYDQIAEEALLLAVLIDEEKGQEIHRKKKRKIWVHEVNLQHSEGEFLTIYPMLRQDENHFYKYYRMKLNWFDELLDLIKDGIIKEHTNFRQPISPTERLSVTLRFLWSTGSSYKSIGHSYRIGFSTVSTIVAEVCKVIWEKLQPIYMPEPTKELWENSVTGYENIWGYPNCLGCIDGKHVTIKCPKNSGSKYFSYLKKFSIVLMAIVDPEYKFICVDIGGYGKNSDAGIFGVSTIGKKFANGSFNLPDNKSLPGFDEPIACVLIGDEGFGLSSYLIRPFPYRQARQDQRKEKFNYRLCQTRRIVENAFGIMAQKWRILLRPIEVKPETAIDIVKACCILHNFLRSKNTHGGLEERHERTHMREIRTLANLSADGRRGTNYAFQLHEKFVDYFNK